jgi:hypothetical protein
MQSCALGYTIALLQLNLPFESLDRIGPIAAVNKSRCVRPLWHCRTKEGFK